MSAQLKHIDPVPFEPRRSLRDDALLLPIVTAQMLFVAEVANLEPRREPRREETAPPPMPWPRRLLTALTGIFAPYQPQYLSEHLCRDIGLDWNPEPPVHNWPW